MGRIQGSNNGFPRYDRHNEETPPQEEIPQQKMDLLNKVQSLFRSAKTSILSRIGSSFSRFRSGSKNLKNHKVSHHTKSPQEEGSQDQRIAEISGFDRGEHPSSPPRRPAPQPPLGPPPQRPPPQRPPPLGPPQQPPPPN